MKSLFIMIIEETQSENSDKPKKRPNDLVRRVKNWDQVEKMYLDLDSPMFKQACTNLGLETKDC